MPFLSVKKMHAHVFDTKKLDFEYKALISNTNKLAYSLLN